MPRQPDSEDRNFDDLAARFARNVYGGLKGRIRLAVLRRDFARHIAVPPFVPGTGQPPLRILDAGAGEAPFSLRLARAGHAVTLCDVSAEMLKRARRSAEALEVADRVTFVQGPVQALARQRPGTGPFDLVLGHALLEWVAEPEALLDQLVGWLRPGGYLSLSYYNRHGAVYKNLLRTNFRKVSRRDYRGARGSLSPPNPLEPETVDRWLADRPLDRLASSGIRVFHDYILDAHQRERDPEQLLALELALSQREPYRSLGRYIHVLLRKINSDG